MESALPSDSPLSPRIELGQVASMLMLLYQPGDHFALFTYPDDKGEGARRHDWFEMSGSVLDDLGRALVEQNVRQPRGAALSVCAFNGAENRAAKNTTGISALAVDIDQKNLDRLVPGIGSPECAVPQVMALLARHRLRPHAVVVSGHGLHLYFAIERVHLVDDEVRQVVKQTWKKLGALLGNATDRHDLASVMRCWGTTNWKDGQPGIPVRLLVEHSDLERPRYRLVDIAETVKDVAVKKARPARKPTVSVLRPVATEVDPWSAHILDTMAVLDERFALTRARSRGEVKVKDRSVADHAYARFLFECGWPTDVVEAEISLSAKGAERGELYVNSTVQAAANESPPPASVDVVEAFQPFDDVSKAAYKVLRSTPSSSCGASNPSSPRVLAAVVASPPGSQKTRGVMSFFARALGDEFGRVGIMTAFIAEAARIEHAINTLHPFGFDGTINGRDVQFEQDLPKEHVRFWDDGTIVGGLLGQLPSEVRFLRRRDGGLQWSPEALSIRSDIDPATFFINAYQPRYFDRRFEWYEDQDGAPARPFWAMPDDDEALYQAHAVAKFRAIAKLCLAGRSQKDLDRPGACRGCCFKACRSNPEPGAARSYWRSAPVALLTHGAYRAHHLFRPDLNEFDGLVCDEVPDFVYRTPRLQVTARTTSSDRASWEVEPLDGLLRLVDRALVVPNSRVSVIIEQLRERRDLLAKQASKLRSEVMDGDRSPHEYKVEDVAPLLTNDDFQTLAHHVGRAVHADLNPEDTPDEVAAALADLRDFSGELPFQVLAEQQFTRDGSGSLVIVRPVDGWPDLLHGPDGSRRPLVMLDATAGLDPRYLLAGGFEEERLPSADFPATTIVLTSTKTVTKTDLHRQTPEEVVADLIERLRQQRIQTGSRVLVVTDKDSEEGISKAVETIRRSQPTLLPATVLVDHFGNLRGKNQYIECDAVYFTHCFRRPDEFYLGLELLLASFEGYPRQWVQKNEKPWHIRNRAPEVLCASMVCDLFQDLMRICIRRDPTARATVFLPTSDARLVTRVLRLMREVALVLPDGHIVAPRGGIQGGGVGGSRPPSPLAGIDGPVHYLRVI